jgi:hypothetical protein
MESVKETFTLYLAPWQIRMAHDFLPSDVKQLVSVKIKPGVIRCPASYKIPDRGLSRHDWVLYLTDEQMIIVHERFNLKTPISGINVTPDLIEKGSITFR